MNCPRCNKPAKVYLSKQMADGRIKRRRKCTECGFRWTSYQMPNQPEESQVQPRGQEWWKDIPQEAWNVTMA